MKIATCIAVVFASVVSAQAAPPVSVNSLNVIGLSNLSRMSDAQGNQVRAKYTYAAGGSLARVSARQGGAAGNAQSHNGAGVVGKGNSSQGNVSGAITVATGGHGWSALDLPLPGVRPKGTWAVGKIRHGRVSEQRKTAD